MYISLLFYKDVSALSGFTLIPYDINFKTKVVFDYK